MARNGMNFAVSEQDDEIEIAEPVTAVTTDINVVNARIKGTWRMYWGTAIYDFVDGNRYTIPRALFDHLKEHGNIYDTL